MGPVIGMISDRTRYGRGDAALDELVAAVRAAARAGVHLVQVRERDLDGGALARLVARCVDAARGTRARVLVNDRADVARAARAHGVHLPGHGVPASRLRALLPPAFLLGRSVHSVMEGTEAGAAGGLDYLLFGTVFETPSKPAIAPAGTEPLRRIASQSRLPVLAVGGVTADRFGEVAASGAAGFAGIGLFAEAWTEGPEGLQKLVAQAHRAFDTSSTVP